MVDEVSVEICHFFTRQRLKLLNGANDDNLLPVVATPDGDWGAPKTSAGDGPISCIPKPIVKAAA